MKGNRRHALWLGGTALVLGLGIIHLSRSAEWRGFHWNFVWSSLIHAHRGFLLAAVAATCMSYLMRAYRWRFFLDPIKKTSLWILFVGQILGFSSIYLIGRPGEFVRPAYIAKKEEIPISAMLAVWLLERIYDIVCVLLLFVGGLELLPLHPTTPRGRIILTRVHRGGVLLLVVMALVVATLVAFRLRNEALEAWMVKRLGFLPPPVKRRIDQIFRSFSDGLEAIRNWKDLLASVLTTAMLWIINTSVVWFVFHSWGGALGQLSWISSGLVLFFLGLGLLVQLPGVGGGSQEAVILALTRIFGVKAEAATGAAILLWIVMAGSCLALGLVLLVCEGLSFKKLGALAKEERGKATVGSRYRYSETKPEQTTTGS